jgi:hypothetical protein
MYVPSSTYLVQVELIIKALPPEKNDERMAMALAIDERALLVSALDQWEGLIARVNV